MMVFNMKGEEKLKVSVIIPCYNQAGFLSETLDSVLSQTYPNWECVIVNDGSPDNTEEIAKDYCEKDPRFHYVFQNNQGVSSARNLGIKVSTGCFVLPLDGDDIIAPEYIEKALACFAENPETKLVYSKANQFGIINGYWDLPEYTYDSFIWANCIYCTAMFKRSDYDKTIGYNPNMIYGNEDWDFWLSLLSKNDIVHRIDEVLFYYRVKEASRTTELQKQHLNLEHSLIQLYRNHKDIYEPFVEDYLDRIVLNHSKIKNLDYLELRIKEYDRALSSSAYRLGKWMLKPFSWLRNLL